MANSFVREIDATGQIVQIPRAVYDSRELRKRKRRDYVPNDKRRKLSDQSSAKDNRVGSGFPHPDTSHAANQPNVTTRQQEARLAKTSSGTHANSASGSDEFDDYLRTPITENANEIEFGDDTDGEDCDSDNDQTGQSNEVNDDSQDPGPREEVDTNTYALPPFSLRVKSYLFSEEYQKKDDDTNCPGCDLIEAPYPMLPLRNETRKFFKSKLYQVAIGPVVRNAKRFAGLYARWLAEERRCRIDNSDDPANDWPEWLVIRHVFLHTNNPRIKVRIEEYIVEQNLLYAYAFELRSPHFNKQSKEIWRMIKDSHEILRKLRLTRYDRMNDYDNSENPNSNLFYSLIDDRPGYDFYDIIGGNNSKEGEQNRR